MISIHIERVTIEKESAELHDTVAGKTEKIDKWHRRTLYMQAFEDGAHPDIDKVIRVANRGYS